MNTSFLLMAQYSGKAIIPVEDLCRDYFPHLTPEKFVRKVTCGNIDLPLIRIEESQKTAKGVHIDDLAIYLDNRRAKALREYSQMHR